MAFAKRIKTDKEFIYEFEKGVCYRPIFVGGVTEYLKK